MPWENRDFENYLRNNIFARRGLLDEADKALRFWRNVVAFTAGIKGEQAAKITTGETAKTEPATVRRRNTT